MHNPAIPIWLCFYSWVALYLYNYITFIPHNLHGRSQKGWTCKTILPFFFYPTLHLHWKSGLKDDHFSDVVSFCFYLPLNPSLKREKYGHLWSGKEKKKNTRNSCFPIFESNKSCCFLKKILCNILFCQIILGLYTNPVTVGKLIKRIFLSSDLTCKRSSWSWQKFVVFLMMEGA